MCDQLLPSLFSSALEKDCSGGTDISIVMITV